MGWLSLIFSNVINKIGSRLGDSFFDQVLKQLKIFLKNHPVGNKDNETGGNKDKDTEENKDTDTGKNHKVKEFILGNRKTSVVVIDGDGYKIIDSNNIRAHVSKPTSRKWPEEVEQYYAKSLLEIQEKEEKGENNLWDGPIFSLRKYRIRRITDLEENAIELHLEEFGFYRVHSTISNLGSGPDSLRQKYIDSFDFDSGLIYELPNAIGIAMLIKTRDNKAIFVTRSNSSGYRPGEHDVSVVEGVQPKFDYDGDTISFEKVAKRATIEEICGKDKDGTEDKIQDKIDVSILGFVFDKEYNQWNIIGFIDLRLTQDEIVQRRNSGISGKWELTSLDFIEFTLKDIMEYLSKHKMWDMGLVTTYFSLVYNHHSSKMIQEYAKGYLE